MHLEKLLDQPLNEADSSLIDNIVIVIPMYITKGGEQVVKVGGGGAQTVILSVYSDNGYTVRISPQST